jgi:hypothetical protein
MISVDVSQIDKVVADLGKFAKRAMPHAVRNATNELAFKARKVWVSTIEEKMVLRNRYTLRSIRVDKAKGVDIERMQAVLGSGLKYMAAQEEGASHQLRNRHAIPTGASAGQRGARPRTKQVRRPNQLSAIDLSRRLHTGSRAQRNAANIRMARKAGKKVVYLESAAGHKGLFRMNGGRARGKHGRFAGSSAQLSSVTMLWETGKSSRPVPANPTLGPTVQKVSGGGPEVFLEALIDQAKRHKVMGY